MAIGKRGDIDLQFNYIYVLVIGGLILLVAANFVISQQKAADTLISTKIIEFTRSMLTHSSSTSGKASLDSIQKDLGLTCVASACSDYGCPSEIYIMPKSEKSAMTPTEIEPIFAFTSLKGEQLMTWSLEWSTPFHVSNFLYLSTNKARYLFVSPGGDEGKTIESLYNYLPELMPGKEMIDSSELMLAKDRNNYKVKLIFFGEGASVELPASLSKMKNADVTAVKLVPKNPSDPESFGTAYFYKKTGGSLIPDGESYYIGKSGAYGAIFTESHESFKCNMHKASIRMALLAELYHTKVTELNNEPGVQPQCKALYATALTTLASMSSLKYPSDFDQLDSLSESLAENNKALKVKSCPLIY